MDSSAGDIASVLRSAWTGSELVHALTHHNKLFFFSYSPRLKSLVSWSSNCRELLGISEAALARDANLFLRHTHHEDRFKLLPALESALRDGTNYRVTYRWIRPDNKELCWLHCRAKLSRYDNENLFEGVILDLTEELHTQFNNSGPDSEQNLLDALPFPIGILDADLRLSQLSATLQHLTFGDPDFLSDNFQIGRHFLRCFKNTTLREQYRSALLAITKGNESEQELAYNAGNKWIRIILRPLENGDNPPGILITAIDRSESVQLINEVDSLRESKRIEIVTHAMLSSINEKLRNIQSLISSSKTSADPRPLLDVIENNISELSQLENTLHELNSILPPEVSAPHNFSVIVASAIRRAPRIFDGGRQIVLEIAKSATVIGPISILKNLLTSFIEHGVGLFSKNTPVTISIELAREQDKPVVACLITPRLSLNHPIAGLNDEQLAPWDNLRTLADQLSGRVIFDYFENGLRSVAIKLPISSF